MEPRFLNHGDRALGYEVNPEPLLVSMEPRFFNHGDLLTDGMQADNLERFQWSHGFSTMETRDAEGNFAFNLAVSMEPRFFNHGDAEMDLRARIRAARQFQWSHGF